MCCIYRICGKKNTQKYYFYIFYLCVVYTKNLERLVCLWCDLVYDIGYLIIICECIYIVSQWTLSRFIALYCHVKRFSLICVLHSVCSWVSPQNGKPANNSMFSTTRTLNFIVGVILFIQHVHTFFSLIANVFYIMR